VKGAAVVLCDDVVPPNYCHWLLDELPRLAFLGERRDVTVLTSGDTPKWKTDSLALCGFDPRPMIRVANFEAVRADRLLVSRDIHAMPHPAHKAAPWALNFLRARMGVAALAATPGEPGMRKLYVSRNDAGGRRVLNEAALMERLRPLGYRMVTPGRLGVADQVATFARASHVVGMHGAALANFVFAPPGAQLVEIFPATYGMASYYLLAAGQGSAYASYVENDVTPGGRDQQDDITLDIDAFLERCGALL
jgi:capsular polysaccharide biosynthesis protein